MIPPKVIGIFKSDITVNLEHTALAASVKARDLGYETVTTDNIELFQPDSIAGLIYLSRRETDAPMLQRLESNGLPVVAAGVAISGITSVVPDNIGGMNQALQHLVSLGHKRIAFLRGPRGVYDSETRCDGFVSGLNDLNIDYDPSLVIQAGFDAYHGREEMYNLLASRSDFTAVVCGSDRTSIGAITAIRQSGLKVPEDIAVLSIGNSTRIHSLTEDKITSVHNPVYHIGLEAANLLAERIENPNSEIHLKTVPTHLVTRETCGGSLLTFNASKKQDREEYNLLYYLLDSAGDLDSEQIETLVQVFHETPKSERPPLDTLKEILIKGIELGLTPLVFHNLMVDVLGEYDYWSLIAKGAPSRTQVLRTLQDRSRNNIMFYRRYYQDVGSRFSQLNEGIFNLHVDESAADDFGYTIQELQKQLQAKHISLTLLDQPSLSLKTYAGTATLWQCDQTLSLRKETIEFSPNGTNFLDLITPIQSLRSSILMEIKSLEGICGLLAIDLDTEFSLFIPKLAPLLSAKLQRTRMVDSLRKQADELAKESEKAENALHKQEELRQQAELANNAKSEFLTVMSHELRTPLNTIIGMTNIVLDSKLDEDARDKIEIVRDASDSVLDIVNNLLDFSKLDSGTTSLKSSVIDIRACLQECIASRKTVADAKGLHLAYEVDSEIPEKLIGDVERLKQILLHLLDNSLKFTREGAISIEVNAQTINSDPETLNLVFEIKDTGIGIELEQQPEIFDIIKRAESGEASLYGGSALGLSIAARLTKQMGGRIWMESEADVGSSFFVSLPYTIVFEPNPRTDKESYSTDRKTRKTNSRILIVSPNYDIDAYFHDSEFFSDTRTLRVDTITHATDEWRDAFRQQDPFHVVILEQKAISVSDLETLASVAFFRTSELMLITSDDREALAISTHRSITKLPDPLQENDIKNAFEVLFDSTPPAADVDQDQSEDRKDKTSSLKILIVDDNASNQLVAQNMLERAGHTTCKAFAAKDGIELWRRGNFDIVLMDIQMPEMNGWQATRIIREEEKGQECHTIIIALTSHAINGFDKKCYDAGMDGYISKPIERESFLRYIANAPERLKPQTAQYHSSIKPL